MFAARRPACGCDCPWKIQHGTRQMRVAFHEFRQESTLSTTDIHDVTEPGTVDRGCMDRCAAVLVPRDEGVEEAAILRRHFHVLEKTSAIRAVKCRLACSNAVFQVVPCTPNAVEAPIQCRRTA